MDKDKIKGSIYGLLLGDALGTPHEFKYQKKNYTGKLEFKALILSRYQPRKHLAIGQYSDDSEMFLCMIRSIIEYKKYIQEDVLKRYLKWANTTSLLGKNTRDLLKGIKTIKGYKKRFFEKFQIESYENDLKDSLNVLGTFENAQSNGSLMRSLGLAFVDKADIKKDVFLTNPSLSALKCEEIYVEILKMSLKNENIDTIWDVFKNFIESNEINTETTNKLYEDIQSTERDIITNKGWCYNSLYCAMLCLYKLKNNSELNYSDLIDDIIRRWCDTDTNAAISGALVGSILGYKRMKKDPVTKENLSLLKKYMNGYSNDETDLIRDEEYLVKDIDNIVDILYEMNK